MNNFNQHAFRDRHAPGPGRRPPPVPVPQYSVEQEPKESPWSPADSETLPQDWNSSSDQVYSKGRAPQRPPWPNDIPSFPNAPHQRGYPPNGPQPVVQQGPVSPWDNLPVPMPSIQHGRHDFHHPSNTAFLNQPHPVTLPPPILKKAPGLGPPPSSRRAPTSYYSTTSNVSPIPEEFSDKTARNATSFASSKAIPSSWGSAPPESFILRSTGSADGSPDEDDIDGPLPDDEVTLVRQASLGKRGRPSLRTISRSQTERSPYDNSSVCKIEGDTTREISMSSTANQKSAYQDSPSAHPATVNSTGRPRSFSHSSSEHSFDSGFEKKHFPTVESDAEVADAELKEAGMDNINAPGISKTRPDMKRPPRLDIDAVKEAESRGSLTSLHDLIRRATKVRTNLDGGRTASRLGILDMFNGSGELNKKPRRIDDRRASSLSNILASFPPPGFATPTGGSRSRANPTVTFPDPDLPPPQKPKRRCCGMPLWAFILVMILLVVLITAAVVIPVMLIVVPRQQNATAASQPMSTAVGSSSCRTSRPCMNGGVSIGGPDSCGCVCVDGFRGSTCEIRGDSSCVPQSVGSENDSIENATLGSALPRLLEKSEAKFDIPLDASKILALFNSDGVSCTSQNALVTFAGSNRKRSLASSILQDKVEKLKSSQVPTQNLRGRRHAHSLVGLIPRDETKPDPISQDDFDFSRVAVLYIYEQTRELSSATDAHDSVEKSLKNPDGKSLNLKYGKKKFTLDLDKHSITLSDGTVVGGR